MSSIKKYAIEETTVHHLRDGNDELMYADGQDGKPDLTKPMRVNLYGPGSKNHARARASAGNRAMDRFKKKGKSDQTHEEQIEETARFLTACTKSMENVEYEEMSGEAMYKAIYSDLELCFIPQQLDKILGVTSNFTKASTTI